MYKRLLVGGLILTLLVTGCNQPSLEGGEATPQNSITSIEDKERESSDNVSGPVLSNDLIRDSSRTSRSGNFDNVGLTIGETAVDFTLKDVDGNTVSLRSLLSEKPVVMVFGSFT